VYALALPQEKEEMELTQAGVERTLDEIFYRRAQKIRAVPSRDEDDPRARNWHTTYVAWEDAATGKPLPSRSYTGEFRTMIDLFSMPDGRWRVSFTRLTADWLLFNMRPEELGRVPDARRWAWIRQWREAQFRQWGIPGTYYDPASIRQDGQVVTLLDSVAYDPVKRQDWKVSR
jgi:hypothetical protein